MQTTITFKHQGKDITLPLDKATVISVDGTFKELEPKNGKTFTYSEIRDTIGNIIEPICLRYYTNKPELKKMNFIMDEEGVINGSDWNHLASNLLKVTIGPNVVELFGTVIFLPNKMFRMY